MLEELLIADGGIAAPRTCSSGSGTKHRPVLADREPHHRPAPAQARRAGPIETVIGVGCRVPCTPEVSAMKGSGASGRRRSGPGWRCSTPCCS